MSAHPADRTAPVVGRTVGRRHARAEVRDVLSSSSVRAFLGLQGLGQMSDAMTTLVLAHVVVFEIERGATPGTIGRTLLVATLPWLVAGPLAGLATDRLDRRAILAASAAARAVVALIAIAVPVTGNRELGYGSAAAILALGATSFVVRGASWPHLVDPDRLVVVNSLSSITGKVAGSCGFAIAAAVGTNRPGIVLSSAAALHVLGAIGFASGRTSLGGGRRAVTTRMPWIASVRHLHRIARRPPTRGAIVAAVAHRSLFGAAFVAFVLLVDRRYDLSASGYAAAIGSTATGAFAGTVLAPVLSVRVGAHRLVTLTFATAACAMAIATVSTGSAAVLAAMIVASCSFQIVRLVTDATVQHHVEDGALGRVYAGFDACYNAAYLVGAGLVVLIDPADPLVNLGAVAVVHAIVATARVVSTVRVSSPVRVASRVRVPSATCASGSESATDTTRTKQGEPW